MSAKPEDPFFAPRLNSTDRSLVTALQSVERYEIGVYSAAATLAGLIGKESIVQLLHDSLREEQDADNNFEALARRSHRLWAPNAIAC